MSGFTDLASGTQKVATHVWDATANAGAGGNLNVNLAAGTISGTFWQAVQPVSGTVSVGSTVGLTDTQLRAAPISVSGTVGVSGTIPISYTQQAIPAGSAVIGHVIVDTVPTTTIEQRRVIPQFVAISAALLGDNTLVALTAGQKIKAFYDIMSNNYGGLIT